MTDREYWAQKKGQAALDKQNAPMIAEGITPRQTKFETNKEKLRQTIRTALSAATSFEDFSSLLLRASGARGTKIAGDEISCRTEDGAGRPAPSAFFGMDSEDIG